MTRTALFSGYVIFAIGLGVATVQAGAPDWFAAAQSGDLQALQANRPRGRHAVDEVDQYGRTALLIASRFGQRDSVKWLLDQGADPNKVEEGNETFIPIPDIKGRKSWYGAEGRTPLMHALIERHTDVATLLLDAGANPKAEDRSGTHMLYFVCDAGLAARLMAAGLDPRKGRSKKSAFAALGEALPLAWAVKCGDPTLVRLYLEAGADPNLRANMGESALHYAIDAKAPLDVIRVLVDGGADVNAMTSRRVTPLMFAAQGNDPEILAFLLERGANPDVVTVNGQTAFDWIRGPQQERKRNILRQAMSASARKP